MELIREWFVLGYFDIDSESFKVFWLDFHFTFRALDFETQHLSWTFKRLFAIHTFFERVDISVYLYASFTDFSGLDCKTVRISTA